MNEVEIIHIFHNCFVLKTPGCVLVFDVPAERFRMRSHLAALEKAVMGENIKAFISHSHTDHFDPDLRKTCTGAASLDIVASDDVVDMYPAFDGDDVLVVEPDEQYSLSGIKVETLMSNDLGVAFIISLPEGINIYFGGDLAKWDWEEAPDAQRAFAADFFNGALRRISQHRIHIAFSNLDKRLKSLAGGPELVSKVRPDIFVPTHAFGRTHWLQGINERLGIAEDRCFIYRKAGDSRVFYLDI